MKGGMMKNYAQRNGGACPPPHEGFAIILAVAAAERTGDAAAMDRARGAMIAFCRRHGVPRMALDIWLDSARALGEGAPVAVPPRGRG